MLHNLCLQVIVCVMEEVCTRLPVKGTATAKNFPLPSINYLGITHMYIYKNYNFTQMIVLHWIRKRSIIGEEKRKPSTIRSSIGDTDLPATVFLPSVSHSIHNKMRDIPPRHRPPIHLTGTPYTCPFPLHQPTTRLTRPSLSLSTIQESAAPPPLSWYVLHWLTIYRRIPFRARTVISYALRGEFILEGFWFMRYP